MRALASPTEFDGDAFRNAVDSSFSSPGGRWRAVAVCGRGGTAEVWHAIARDGREAAFKRLRPELRPRADLRDRLRREFELLRNVTSRCLVRALEIIECDDGPVLVLEYLPNGDLVSLVGTAPQHWLPALRSVVDALRTLHEHGLAHGDVKARNVLFAADQSARLIDLTSARAVDAPAFRTTAAYGLPAGMPATARAVDCFAVAVLLYELTTGRLPYGANRTDEFASPKSSANPSVARLAAAATAMLAAGGRLPQGLSCFADVIESVSASTHLTL